MTITEKKLKQVALYVDTANQVKSLATKKGISIGLYMYNLMEFVIANNIDYSKELITGSIRQEMERPIKILRAYEKEYFRDILTTISLIAKKLESLDVDQVELESISTQGIDKINENFIAIEYSNRELIGRLTWLAAKKENTKNGNFIITLTAQENQIIEDLLKKNAH